MSCCRLIRPMLLEAAVEEGGSAPPDKQKKASAAGKKTSDKPGGSRLSLVDFLKRSYRDTQHPSLRLSFDEAVADSAVCTLYSPRTTLSMLCLLCVHGIVRAFSMEFLFVALTVPVPFRSCNILSLIRFVFVGYRCMPCADRQLRRHCRVHRVVLRLSRR